MLDLVLEHLEREIKNMGPLNVCFFLFLQWWLAIECGISFCSCSGGYNIKTGPGCSIELMKFDMGGSAATFGAAKAIAQIKPPGVEVI